ncbi:putative ribonuclease H-like domain-containing protein [Tanacetum coccineum]
MVFQLQKISIPVTAEEKPQEEDVILLDIKLRIRSRIRINKWYQSFALRNFNIEVMEFESAHSNTTAKLPILKLVIENGNSWVSVPQTIQENGTSVTKTSVPVTAEEKTNKKNDKIVSRLAILGVVIAQEDLNSNILNNLPPEWNTHVVVWMNKAEIETMSIDDLYNNFKIVKQSVKKSVGASSCAQNLAFMTAPSTSSTNDVNTAIPAYEVSTGSPNVNTASPQLSTASSSDNAVYAFMIENPNGSNLLQQDLEQIHEDDLEAMDLKWQLSLLNMRAKRNQDNTRKQGNNEDTSSKAMLAIDGVGFDWSDMAEEQVQTNMALMAFSDSEVYNDKTCSKTCLKNYETLKKQCDDLIVKLNQTEFTAATYKRGLATVEEQLITYRKNEVLFSEEVAVLKREVACKDYEINVLKSEFEKVKQEKEGIEFKIEKFDKASKDLDKLLGSQITDKSKKGLGYNVVPPPHPLIYNRPKKLDLSYSGLDEFKEPEFKSYGSQESKQESNIVCDKKSDASKENSDDSLVKEQVSEDTSSFVESPLNVDKETIFLDKKIEIVKPKNHEKPVKKSVRDFNPNAQRNMVPRAVLMKTGLKPFNTARTVNTAHPKSIVFSAKSMPRFSKLAQSTVRRPFQSKTILSNKRFTQTNNTAKAKAINTARPKAVNTTRPHSTVVNAVRGKPQQDDTGFIDSGCSRHMTGNISYLSDFKKFDGGYVTFGGGAHGGRISGKGQDSSAKWYGREGIRTLIDLLKPCLLSLKLPTTFWAEAVSTACYVQNRVLVVKPHNKTPYELFRGKFDGKSNEDFFVGYSLSSKAFRGTQGELNASTFTQKEEISQDCIVMPIWKDASYLYSSSKGVGSGEPNSCCMMIQKQVSEVITGRFKRNMLKYISGITAVHMN